MRLLYGTTNPAKLSSMKQVLDKLSIDMIGLRDLNTPIPEVEETGNDPLENAVLKAHAYYDTFHLPVFSCDSGLYFGDLSPDLQREKRQKSDDYKEWKSFSGRWQL